MKKQITPSNAYRTFLRLVFFLLLLIAVPKVKAQLPDSWLQKADFGAGARERAVGFSINGKGYTGTGSAGNSFFPVFCNDFWEFDPLSNSWTQRANFPHPVTDAIGFSMMDKGYLGTGYNDTAVYDDFWEYDPDLNSWMEKAPCPGKRSDAVGFSIGNKGYVGTGLNEIGDVSDDFREYDPLTDSWSQKASFGGGNRAGAVAFSIGDKGYVGTGYVNGGKNDFWEFDPVADTWTQKADYGGGNRHDAVGFSIGSKGYAGTGRNGQGFHKDFWEYDPLTDGWIKKTRLGQGASGMNRCMATGFSIGTKGYICLGRSGKHSLPKLGDLWEYTSQCDSPGVIMYPDGDGDGFGSTYDSLLIPDCEPAGGYVFDNSDCNDGNAGINTAAAEICNGIDDNCNNLIDEGLLQTFYADADGDTYGNSNDSITSCASVPGYVTNDGDCDDNDAAISPSAIEM